MEHGAGEGAGGDDLVRWLEDDLAAQAHAWGAADRDAELADRLRTEWARTPVADRWRAAARDAVAVEVEVEGAGQLVGEVVDVGADHAALRGERGQRTWVATRAVRQVQGLPASAVRPATEVEGRWTLAAVLRRLGAAGEPLVLVRRDGAVLAGVVALVGADHVDVLPDGGRRGRVTWPLGEVAVVRAAASFADGGS
jgi:hypothetical protein